MSFLDWLGYRFQERMMGTWRKRGASADTAYRFDLVSIAPSFGSLARDQLLYLDGTLTLGGLAEKVHATGTLRFTPWFRRRLEYELDCVGDDGKPYHVSGLKTIRHLNPFKTWTTLPSKITDAAGNVVGEGIARFPASEFFPLFFSFRITRGTSAPARPSPAAAVGHAPAASAA